MQKLLWKAILGTTKTFGKNLQHDKPTLITIGSSHFSEKARWILDSIPLEFVEDRHLPAFHLARTMSLDNVPRLPMPGIVTTPENEKFARRKERTAVPKLLLPIKYVPAHLLKGALAGQPELSNASAVVIKDGSKGIARYACHAFPAETGHLIPKELEMKVLEVESLAEENLAIPVTNFSFGHFLLTDQASFPGLDNSASVKAFINSCSNCPEIPNVEKMLFNFLSHSVIVPTMIQGNRISVSATARARSDILATFEKLDEIRKAHGCSASSKYLFNTSKPTLADIAVAAYSAPLLLPSRTKTFFLNRDAISSIDSPGAQEFLKFSDKVISRFDSAKAALRMYEEDR